MDSRKKTLIDQNVSNWNYKKNNKRIYKNKDKNQSLNLLFTTSTDYGKCSTEIGEFWPDLAVPKSYKMNRKNTINSSNFFQRRIYWIYLLHKYLMAHD